MREERRICDLRRVARELTQKPRDGPSEEAEPGQAVVTLRPPEGARRAENRAEGGRGPREIREDAANIGIPDELLCGVDDGRGDEGDEIRARRPAREDGTDPNGDHEKKARCGRGSGGSRENVPDRARAGEANGGDSRDIPRSR